MSIFSKFRKKKPDSQTGIYQEDLPLLNDLNVAMQMERHRGLYWTIILLFVLLFVFVVWAYNSNVEEVTRGQGSVIPSSREQLIASLDAGVVSEMLVKEGEVVQKGQVLLKLDTTRSLALLRESKNKVAALKSMATRLRAEAYGTPLDFPDDLPPELVRREKLAYQTRMRAMQEGILGMQEGKALLDREIAVTEPMAKMGVVSEVELLRLKRQSSDLALRITERKNKFMADANTELVRVEADLAQSEENMQARADPVERASIEAPVYGIVKNIKVNTIGGIVAAGQDIMEIVPLDDVLLVEAYIRPADVAFISPNAPALVKISAYDYSLYGGLEGVVTLISPDALRDSKRAGEFNLNPDESFYRVLVKTKSNALTDKNGKPLEIMPGMSATVDIRTGEKSIFHYLTKPITRMKQAFSER